MGARERAAENDPRVQEVLARLPGARLVEVRRLAPEPAPSDDALGGHDDPGERIDDFELLTRLGEGAFGAVFLARQVSMQRIVALVSSFNVIATFDVIGTFDMITAFNLTVSAYLCGSNTVSLGRS